MSIMEKEEKNSSLELRNLVNPKGKQKTLYVLLSFTTVVVLTVVLYLVPDYYFLEKLTNDVVFEVLKIYKYDIVLDGLYSEAETGNSIFIIITNFLTGLDGHNSLTPVIKSLDAQRRFAVVRACTGMQAGALLMALIIVTPADFKKKFKATIYSLIALIIGNFLRIAIVIGMTITLEITYGTTSSAAWMWAHDVLGKPIGFFGTIFFALIIEKQGVPILNTVSLWIDSLLDLFNLVLKKTGITRKESKASKSKK
jgi:exosortase/archaeosortase family protein